MTRPTFTASQIAIALGVKRQTVQSCLLGVEPDGLQIVSGNQAGAWSWQRLPQTLSERLMARAKEQGCAAMDLLAKTPAQEWQPEIPMAELHPECIEYARKLQLALEASIARRNDLSFSREEFDRLGIRDYRAVFGHEISARHFRSVLDRTLERDHGREDWARLEIYLSNNLRRRSDRPGLLAASSCDEFRPLVDLFYSFKDPTQPTSAEQALLWLHALELFEALQLDGAAPKKLRLRLLRFLRDRAPWLAKSFNALRVKFDDKLARWQESGRTPEALADQRRSGEEGPEKRRAAPYNPEEVDLVRYYAATRTEGKRAQAVRELHEAGRITDPRLQHSLETRRSKSYLPASFRNELTDVPALRVMALGKRATRKMVPALKLTFEGLHSMEMVTGDDKTADVYVPVWREKEGWYEMLRPQILLFVDVKSLFIVGRAILPRSQYTALDVYTSYKTIFKKWGLPKFIQREGGLWRKAKQVNSLAEIGRPAGACSPAEVEFELGRRGTRLVGNTEEEIEQFKAVGINFREVFTANAKIVERVLGVISDEFAKMPGFCGRREVIDCPEATKKALALVRAKKAEPESLGFLNWVSFVAGVDAIIGRYNTAKQEGRRLAHPQTGLPMSPEEAFYLYQNADDPPVGFDSQCEVLLSHRRIPVTVNPPKLGRSNLQTGFVTVEGNTYCDEQTGSRIGQKLTAWFDPTMPETCTFTDEFGGEPFTVPRLDPVNGWRMDEQSKEALAQARSAVAALKADFKAMGAKFEPTLRRNIISGEIKAISAEVKAAQAQVAEQRSGEDLQSRARRAYDRAGIMMPARPTLEQIESTERLGRLFNQKAQE